MVKHRRQGATKPLVELIVELNLQSLLLQKTLTYSVGPVNSTIDLLIIAA